MSTHRITLENDMTSTGLYLAEIGDLPRLTHAEECTLARRIKQGDESARERMILANLRLVVYVAKRYGTSEMDLLDHIQNGYFGLVKAVEQFDENRNIHFSTYAVHWIRQAVTREQQRHRRLVHLPFYIQAQIYALDRASDEYWATHGTEPEASYLADCLGVPVSHIHLLLANRSRALSLDYSYTSSDEDGNTLLECMADSVAFSSFEQVDERDEQARVREQVRYALSALGEREREVVILVFGLDGGDERSYAEVGRSLGISRERVRQILSVALSKLSCEELLQSLCNEQEAHA